MSDRFWMRGGLYEEDLGLDDIDEYGPDEIEEALEELSEADAQWIDVICSLNDVSTGYKNSLIYLSLDFPPKQWRREVNMRIANLQAVSGCTFVNDPDTMDHDPLTTMNDEGQDNMELSMTVDRLKLLDALKAKREEVKTDLTAKIDALKAKIEEFSGDSTIVDYLQKLVELAKDNKLDLNDYNGRDHAARGNFQHLISVILLDEKGQRDTRGELLVAPIGCENTARIANTKQQLRVAEQKFESELSPYDAAIQLLEMSVDDNIGIAPGEYQRLLAGKSTKQQD